MRPTEIRRSEMPGPKVYNLWWGDKGVQKQRGIIQYSISPWQQRAAHQLIRNYIFNGYRRLSSQLVYWVVPFAFGYSVYSWAKRYDTWQNSKAAHVAGHGAH
ncbi:cytochrome b-c1 complex subunit 8 [Daedaleopsis nitida]|nr:cytochrome b-c1 complex subunit 8 [Daedaleopsis nitida]